MPLSLAFKRVWLIRGQIRNMQERNQVLLGSWKANWVPPLRLWDHRIDLRTLFPRCSDFCQFHLPLTFCITQTLTAPVAASSGDLQPSSAGWPNPAFIFINTLCQCPSLTLLDCAICSTGILTEKYYKHVCLLTENNGPLWLRSVRWKEAREADSEHAVVSCCWGLWDIPEPAVSLGTQSWGIQPGSLAEG